MGIRHGRAIAAALILQVAAIGAAAAAGAATDVQAPASDAQRANLALVEHWRDTYNTDVAKMVEDCYAPDALVEFTGASARGHTQFLKLETAIKTAAPGRRMRIDRICFSGDDVVVVEAVILDTARPDFFSPWAAILTIRDGKIVSDHTYLEPNRWPGIEAAAGIPTPGGLGAPASATQ